MKFPSIKEIALALRDTQELIKTDSSCTDESVEVRLQVTDNGWWWLPWGDPSLYQDLSGFWGAATIPSNGRFNSHAIARDLIEQAKEQAAMNKISLIE
jgi:hypothetical protein